MYGFMHMINAVPPHQPQQSNIAIFVAEVADVTLPADEGASISYADVPRTVAAQLADDRLVLVRTWLENLRRPPDLSDSEYASNLQCPTCPCALRADSAK